MLLLPLAAGVTCPGSLGWCLHETSRLVGWCWRGQGCSVVNPWEQGVTLWLKATPAPGAEAEPKPCSSPEKQPCASPCKSGIQRVLLLMLPSLKDRTVRRGLPNSSLIPHPTSITQENGPALLFAPKMAPSPRRNHFSSC